MCRARRCRTSSSPSCRSPCRIGRCWRRGRRPSRRRAASRSCDYQVPQAVIKLKQGFGRLIRTATDTGMVVILDPRVLTKGYGRMFLAALPECRRFVDGAPVPDTPGHDDHAAGRGGNRRLDETQQRRVAALEAYRHAGSARPHPRRGTHRHLIRDARFHLAESVPGRRRYRRFFRRRELEIDAVVEKQEGTAASGVFDGDRAPRQKRVSSSSTRSPSDSRRRGAGSSAVDRRVCRTAVRPGHRSEGRSHPVKAFTPVSRESMPSAEPARHVTGVRARSSGVAAPQPINP